MVGGKYLCLECFIVGVAALVGAASLAASVTFVALASVLKAEADDVCTAAVIAKNGLGYHAKQSTTTP